MITSGDQQQPKAGIVPNKPWAIPTQAEINKLSLELESAAINSGYDIHWRAALMIARLEIALLQYQPNGD